MSKASAAEPDSAIIFISLSKTLRVPPSGKWRTLFGIFKNFKWGWYPNAESAMVVTPVSYTHLDVYKRQAYDAAAEGRAARIEHVFTHNSRFAVSQRFQNADLGSLFIHHSGHGGDAVSYTHLSWHRFQPWPLHCFLLDNCPSFPEGLLFVGELFFLPKNKPPNW